MALPVTGFAAADFVEPPPPPVKMDPVEKEAAIQSFEAAVAETIPLQIGDSEEALIQRLGKPGGVVTFGNKKRLSYEEGYALVSGGQIIGLNNISEERLKAPDLKTFEAYQHALGKVYYMGRWMTREESDEAYVNTVEARKVTEERIKKGQAAVAVRSKNIARKEAPYRDIRKNGARISRQDLIIPGKITVVDFYADWCRPCLAMAPYLQRIAEDPDVAVTKVDIVKWQSPVAQQWKLRSIPNMRVFDRSGQQIGKETGDLRQVVTYIQQAKARPMP